MEDTVQKTWKPTVVGLMNIFMAVLNFLGSIFAATLFFAVESEHLYNGFFMEIFPSMVHDIVRFVFAIDVFGGIVVTVLQLLGGIYALKRKRWVLVLISSAVAILQIFPIGIPATIFTVISKNEFE